MSEAAASGTPVVATRNGCLPVVAAGVGGFVAYGGDFSSGEATAVLQDLPSASTVRKAAEERWHYLAIARQYQVQYQRVLAGEHWGEVS